MCVDVLVIHKRLSYSHVQHVLVIQLSCFAMFLEHFIRFHTSFFDLNIQCVM